MDIVVSRDEKLTRCQLCEFKVIESVYDERQKILSVFRGDGDIGCRSGDAFLGMQGRR